MKGRSHKIHIPGLSPTEEGAPPGAFILTIEGDEATGKSKFALEAPGPFAYFGIDPGADRAVKRARREGKEVHFRDLSFDVPKFVPKQERDFWEAKAAKIKKEIFEPYVETWDNAATSDHVRALVMDTATEIWDLHQLAHFGKLQQNPQLMYGPVKSEYMNMVKKARREGKLVILLHHLADEYKTALDPRTGQEKRERTGKKVRQAMNKTHYLEDGRIRMIRQPEEKKKRGGEWVVVKEGAWQVEIITAKNDRSMEGQILDDPSFEEVMLLLDPDTDPAFWSE